MPILLRGSVIYQAIPYRAVSLGALFGINQNSYII
jgi:hypothetical protein